VFDAPYTPPRTDGTGNIRPQIRDALRLFAEAGWEVRDGVLTNVATGEPMTFEILLRAAVFERVTEPFVANLARVGITATMRTVDSAQWQKRYQDRDFEVIVFAYTFYPPPGTELRSYFGSQAADVPGSANLAGIKDPVVDALIEEIVATSDLASKQAATRALDRVLLEGRYVVPQWRKTGTWIAYWDRFGFPATVPPYDFGLGNGIAFQPTWWIDPEKDARLQRGP
jgi:microcin C transport system substrate-binding protein